MIFTAEPQSSQRSKKMNIPFLDLKRQYKEIKEEVDASIHRVVDSQHFILGAAVKEFEDKIDEGTKNTITEAMNKLKKMMEGNDAEAIKNAAEELTTAAHKLAEKAYKQASAQQQAQTCGTGSTGFGQQQAENSQAKDDKVVDADFEVVDDGKA